MEYGSHSSLGADASHGPLEDIEWKALHIGILAEGW